MKIPRLLWRLFLVPKVQTAGLMTVRTTSVKESGETAGSAELGSRESSSCTN